MQTKHTTTQNTTHSFTHSVLPCGRKDFVDKQEHGFLAGQVDPPPDNVHELGHWVNKYLLIIGPCTMV